MSTVIPESIKISRLLAHVYGNVWKFPYNKIVHVIVSGLLWYSTVCMNVPYS